MRDRGYGVQYKIHVVSGYGFFLATWVCIYLSWVHDPRLVGMLWTTIVFGYVHTLTEKGG